MNTTKALSPMLFLAMMSGTANTEEIPEPYDIVMRNGTICDTVEQIETVITKISVKEDPTTQGCGIYAGAPMPAIVTPLHWYRVPDANILIAQLFFPLAGEIQYAWVQVVYIAPVEGSDA